MAQLERRVPAAYKIWRQLFENGRNAYLAEAAGNLSVEEDKWGKAFAAFMSLYCEEKGWLLDIGCGPQQVPSYLMHYPSGFIVGMDPLISQTGHPFQFIQGIAEWIPFENDTFDYITSAASLDHVLLLDQAVEEIYRVLKPGGKFLLWTGTVEGVYEEYQPYRETVLAVDEFHMFHIHPSWFEPFMEQCSFVKEGHYQDRWGNHFYAYAKY